jgi:hypothetical protein
VCGSLLVKMGVSVSVVCSLQLQLQMEKGTRRPGCLSRRHRDTRKARGAQVRRSCSYASIVRQNCWTSLIGRGRQSNTVEPSTSASGVGWLRVACCSKHFFCWQSSPLASQTLPFLRPLKHYSLTPRELSILPAVALSSASCWPSDLAQLETLVFGSQSVHVLLLDLPHQDNRAFTS